MKTIRRTLVATWWLITLVFSPLLAQAAAGDVDLSFDTGSGVNGVVRTIAVQSDGKAFIGGDFTNAKGVARNRIARLNSDGSVDTSFNPSTGANNSVFSVAVQTNGAVLIGGNFSSVNGINRNYIARMNANGTLDTSFNPGTGANGFVECITVQTDGKVLIGGNFTELNGTNRNRIARLNANGSLDTSFNPGNGADDTVYTVAIQTDGKVLVGGEFITMNGAFGNRRRIARLNADGSLDTGFDPGLGAGGGNDPAIRSVVMQTDGKVLIGGAFTTVNGTNRGRIARVNASGGLDTTFTPSTGADGDVYSVALQTDGKVIIGGLFSSVNGNNRNGIARLNANGSTDNISNFNPGLGLSGGSSANFLCMALQSDGKVLIGGGFTTVNGINGNHRGIARLHANGSLDNTFDPRMGASGVVTFIAPQADGKVIIAGQFTNVNNTARNRIARLNADGSLDVGFDPGSGPNAAFNFQSVALQPDGKVLIGGDFTAVNGINRSHIARLNADGSVDTSFNPGSGVNGTVISVALQPDNKVIIGGNFTTVNGTNRSSIARLNANGSLDTGFNPSPGADGAVFSVVLQTNGQVLIGGSFNSVNGTNRPGIARLNANGSLDASFNPGTGAFGVQSLAVQADGKVIVVGSFLTMNGVTRRRIARLNSDGSLNTDADPGTGASSTVDSVALLADGKVLIGGSFTAVNEQPRGFFARLESDASFLDTSFSSGGGANGIVSSISVQRDGKVLVAGYFTAVDGVTRGYITRLLGDAAVLTFGPVRVNGDFVARFLGTPGLTYTLEYRTNLSTGNWQKLANQVAPATDTGLGLGVFELRDAIVPSGLRFYRSVYPAY